MYYNKMIKLYKVEFMKYHNYSYDAVSTPDEKDHDTIALSEPKYLIIKESDIEYYKRFGNGIKSMEFVGYMEDRDVTNS